MLQSIVLSLTLISCMLDWVNTTHQEYQVIYQQKVDKLFDEKTTTYKFVSDIESFNGVVLDPRCTHVSFISLPPHTEYVQVNRNVKFVQMKYVDYWEALRFCAHHFPYVETLRIVSEHVEPITIPPGEHISLPYVKYLSIPVSPLGGYQHAKPLIDLLIRQELILPQLERVVLYCIPDAEAILAHDLFTGFESLVHHATPSAAYTILYRNKEEEMERSLASVSVQLRAMEQMRNQEIVDRICNDNPLVELREEFLDMPSAEFVTSCRGVRVPDGIRILSIVDLPHLSSTLKQLILPSGLAVLKLRNTVSNWADLFDILRSGDTANQLKVLYVLPNIETELPEQYVGSTLRFPCLSKLVIGWDTLHTLLDNGIIQLPRIIDIYVEKYDSPLSDGEMKIILRRQLAQFTPGYVSIWLNQNEWADDRFRILFE